MPSVSCHPAVRDRRREQVGAARSLRDVLAVHAEETAIACGTRRRVLQPEQAIRTGKRERLKVQRVDDPENGGVAADAETEGQHDDGCEARSAAHGTRAVSRILPEHLQRVVPAGCASVFLDDGRVTERSTCMASGGFGIDAFRDQVVGCGIDERRQFIVERLLVGA
jgi:hypothetical protein